MSSSISEVEDIPMEYPPFLNFWYSTDTRNVTKMLVFVLQFIIVMYNQQQNEW